MLFFIAHPPLIPFLSIRREQPFAGSVMLRFVVFRAVRGTVPGRIHAKKNAAEPRDRPALRGGFSAQSARVPMGSHGASTLGSCSAQAARSPRYSFSTAAWKTYSSNQVSEQM